MLIFNSSQFPYSHSDAIVKALAGGNSYSTGGWDMVETC